MTHNNQKGFTLVELVVVLAILSILAAVAVPKYVSHVREARMAALSGLAGSIRSAVMLVQSKYVSLADYTLTTIPTTDGTLVTVSNGITGGIPASTAGGIDNAIKVDGTFTST